MAHDERETTPGGGLDRDETRVGWMPMNDTKQKDRLIRKNG
jgi:hypothetical protein